MQANTKLTTEQKVELKLAKLDNPDITLVNNGETVIAFRELGNTVEFSTSVMAPTEKKFRRKVGEYFALSRFCCGESVKMTRYDFFYMLGNTFYISV